MSPDYLINKESYTVIWSFVCFLLFSLFLFDTWKYNELKEIYFAYFLILLNIGLVLKKSIHMQFSLSQCFTVVEDICMWEEYQIFHYVRFSMCYKKQNKNSDAFFQNIEWYSLFSLSRFLLRRLSFVFHSLVILVCILDQKETINRLDHWHISKMMSDYVFICSLFILSLLPSIHSQSPLPPGMLILLFNNFLIHFFNMSCYIYN